MSQRLPVKVCVCQYMSLLLRIPVTCSYCRLNFLFMGIRFREDLISRVFKGSLIAYNRQKREIKDRRIVKYQQGVRITTKDCKGLQRTADEYAEERRIYKDLISKNSEQTY